MAMNPFKNNFVVGVTSGLVAALLAPVLIPALRKGTRPMAKALIKEGVVLYEKGREVAAHAGEMVEDVMAEIHAEQIEKHSADDDEHKWEERTSMENADNSHLKSVPSRETSAQTKQHGTVSS
jgi:hypothetical protein